MHPIAYRFFLEKPLIHTSMNVCVYISHTQRCNLSGRENDFTHYSNQLIAQIIYFFFSYGAF